MVFIGPEAESLAQGEFSPHILRIINVPEPSVAGIGIGLHQRIEQAQKVACDIHRQVDILVGSLGIEVRIGGVMQVAGGSGIEVVDVGVSHEGVEHQGGQEVVVYAQQAHYADLYGIDLVVEVPVRAGISERS